MGLSALLFLCAAAAQIAVFSESAAQVVTLDYAENDPRYNTVEPCQTLRGTVQIAANGQSVCSEIDRNDTFCIVGSKVAFPCRGLYKHVVLCNKEHNRIALNPFFCGKRCRSESETARGESCIALAEECERLGVSDLFVAVVGNYANCAGILIDAGANVHAKNARGETVLHLTANNDAVQVAAALIAGGATVDATDGSERTPLYFAAFSNSTLVAALLINNGADVNSKRLDGSTPLHAAANNSAASQVAELLISNGARVNEPASGFLNNTPLHYVGGVHDAFMVASVLIKNNANLEAKNLRGGTPLYEAALNNALQVAELLIDSGAEVNVKDIGGDSIVDVVIFRRHFEMQALLMRHGGLCSMQC